MQSERAQPTGGRPRARAPGGFRSRIVLAMVGLTLAISVALTALTLIREDRDADQALDAQGRHLVEHLASSSLIGLIAGDRDDVTAAAADILQQEDAVQAIIYRDGSVFVVASKPGAETLPPAPGPLAPGNIERRSFNGSGRRIAFLAPLVLRSSLDEAAAFGSGTGGSGPQVVGTAEVVLSLDRLAREQRATIAMNGLVLAGATLLAFLASVLIARRIALPLERLSGAAEQVGSGKLDVALPVETPDEIGKLSAAFNRMTEQLRELEDQKRAFIAMISHELRAPLAAIKGYVQLAERGSLGKLPPSFDKPLQVMRRSTDRLAGHIEALLLYSLLQSQQLELTKAPVEFCALANESAEAIRPRIVDSGLFLDVRMPVAELWVSGDRVRLGQVVDNLLTNAVKFSKPGGRIELFCAREGDHVVLEVRDQGIGIPEEMQSRIFERFFQAHRSDKRSYEGVGLGLSIVRDLVRLHDGTIAVRSKVGEGTTFRVELPCETDLQRAALH